MSRLKSLLGQTAWYGLSSMLGRAIQFLLVPFFTSVLNTGEYGIITELYSYTAFLNVVYLYGMETTYFRYAKNNPETELKMYRLIQTSILISTFIFTGVLVLSANRIANVLEYPDKASFIVTLALIMAIDALVAIPFARLRQFNKAPLFAGARLANIFINIGLNLFFVLGCPMLQKAGYNLSWFDSRELVYYILFSNLVANALWIPMFVSQWKAYRWHINWSALKPLLLYALPLMVMGLAGMVNEVLDRIVLKYWLPEHYYPQWTTLEAVGVYGACYKLSMFMSLAVQSFRFAGEPFFFKNAEGTDSKRLFARVMRWFVVVCAFLFVVVNTNLFWIAPLVIRNPEMLQGLEVVPLLLLANLFLGVYYNLAIWFKLSDRTSMGTWLGISGAMITLVLNLTLIPVLGFVGCAWATLICYGLMMLASYLLGQRHYPVPYDVFSFLRVLVFSCALVATVQYLSPASFLYQCTLSGLSLLLFLALVALEWKLEQSKFHAPSSKKSQG